jgi:hypothetical protein
MSNTALKITLTGCAHAKITTVSVGGYTAPVGREPNPAAHGGVSATEECAGCGARRKVNENGWCREEGAWWDRLSAVSEAGARVSRARAAALEAGARELVSSSGDRVRVQVESDGFVSVRGPHLSEEGDAIVHASGLLALAVRLREAIAEAERL